MPSSGKESVAYLKPPIVGLVLLGIAAGMHIPWAPELGTPLRCPPCALALALVGTAILAWSLAFFARQRTSPMPGSQPNVLVVGGPYRFSRNPMYVAATALLLSVALAVGSLPFLIPPAGFFLVMHFLYIPHEERRMAERFGHAYADYRARVRRWI
ncbi:MAG TPA: isoprenylcysteine carboxylmethyltransferase family protein [Verrucomicrobiae bacterium]|nr:isoprenylcysteine carboxylmethyltransferase family protein [Verrucomicrobiae bacterium]